MKHRQRRQNNSNENEPLRWLGWKLVPGPCVSSRTPLLCVPLPGRLLRVSEGEGGRKKKGVVGRSVRGELNTTAVGTWLL
jgi:hypothetical protein